MPDFASMMSDPNFMNMASSMMQNPMFSNMLNNPNIMEMATNMMGGGGGGANPAAGGMPGGMPAMPPGFSPEMFAQVVDAVKTDPELQGLRDNPKMRGLLDDGTQNLDPSELMSLLSDPEIREALQKVIARVQAKQP